MCVLFDLTASVTLAWETDMPQFKAATLLFSRDSNGTPMMQYAIQYPTGDQATGQSSQDFAQQIITDFYPTAISDIAKGDSDDAAEVPST